MIICDQELFHLTPQQIYILIAEHELTFQLQVAMPLTRYEPAKANNFDTSNLPLHTNTPHRPAIAQPEARPSGELPNVNLEFLRAD
jgi:hypothetical protein